MKDIVIKDKVKEYCHSQNISLRELSRRSGLDFNTISHRGNPTLKTIATIMMTLGCSFDDLYEIRERDL